MKTTIELDPTRITVRVKNAVKRQLRKGVISGGWRSETAKIGDALAETLGLPVTSMTWRGLEVATITMEQKAQLAELVKADWAAVVLESPHYANHPYYRSRHAETMINLTREGTANFFVAFHQAGFGDKASEVIAQSLTPAQRDQIERAIDLLDGTELIHINTYQ